MAATDLIRVDLAVAKSRLGQGYGEIFDFDCSWCLNFAGLMLAWQP